MAAAFKNGRLVRLIVVRRRLFVSFAAGLVLLAALPDSLRLVTRLLASWDLATLIYVTFALAHRSSSRTSAPVAAVPHSTTRGRLGDPVPGDRERPCEPHRHLFAELAASKTAQGL